MNLTIDRGPALASMGRLVGVVERRNTIPILSNVALAASDGVLTMRSTDLDMEAQESLAAEITVPDEITIPCDKLHDIVRNAQPGSQITLARDGKDPRVKVSSGRSRFNLPAIPATDFPKFKVADLGPEFSLPAKTLADMLSRVAFSIADPSPLTVLSCVYLSAEAGELRAVGCQKSGIAIRREAAPQSAEIKALLPPRFVARAVRWLADADGDVVVSSSESLVRLSNASAVLTSKVFDGQYVEYGRVLLEGHEVTASTDQDALAAAVKRVLVVGSLSLRLTFDDSAITVEARGEEAQEGSDEIACTYDGPKVSFLLSASQLLESLASLRGDVVEISFSTTFDPQVTKTGQVVIRAPCDPGLTINIMQPRA